MIMSMVKGSDSPRDRLLDTAGDLFQRHGFGSVGIDRILRESGVAKMTLYRHFASKDEMIAAYLERADEWFWCWAEEEMARARTPERKLLALFDGVAELARSPECFGCVFQGAAMAFPETDHPSHRLVVEHKRAVRDRLAALASEARLRSPARLAEELGLLIDGAWIAARVFGPKGNPARRVREAAKALVEAHRPRTSRPRA
jgi:AcrR family transcriptional regulator